MFTVGIITASDKGAQGQREDQSGPAIAGFIEKIGGKVVQKVIIPDEREVISKQLIAFCDVDHLDLVFTTGGTGFSKRDITPEATQDVIERVIPGFTDLIRVKSFESNPRAILSRAVAGIRKDTIIINLPGSPKGVLEALDIIGPSLVHGIEILKGSATECASHHQ
ncbi:MogA/MoaB family molybdenum cofactor biosynthesis protein [Anoxynatronum buryatiense]|uniref:Molybdopterin adenylyltransferase n=1 Tax=Anoxynatronum buryatiense TaxID=489973 RepID=A0AA45WV64_9CLOT|nr:MogA/MoaB family molybdenum cofactor biosynthesis protein [Anoxynatronum buryatiense]SMP49908.1 molybdopterin adenylyltransferase [Anoxynatronum buryatiense]